MNDSSQHRRTVWRFVWWSVPAMLALLSVWIMGVTRAPSLVWYVAGALVYLGLLTPFCVVALLIQWLIAPPDGWRSKMLAVLPTLLTLYAAWQWVGLFLYLSRALFGALLN